EHAIPSPSSVLDADLTLSPCSPPLLPPPPPPPPPPPFLDHDRPALRKAKARSFNDYGRVGLQTAAGCGGGGHNFRSKSAIQASRSTFPTSPFDDHDLEEKVAASDISSFSSDDVVTDDGEDGDNQTTRRRKVTWIDWTTTMAHATKSSSSWPRGWRRRRRRWWRTRWTGKPTSS
ncbi:Os04g0548500, partial [Oryza sativa Japonica Group]